MKRWLSLLLMVLATLLITTPWLAGKAIEKRYHAMIVQAANASGLRIARLDYRRGWFGSEASTRIEIPAAGGGMYALILHHHIRHGLLIVADDGPHLGLGLIRHEIELPPQLVARSQQLLGSTPPLHMRTLLNLDGSQQWRIESQPMHSRHQESTLLLRPLLLTARIGAGLDSIKGQLHWAGLQITAAHRDSEIAPLEWRFDLRRIRPFVWSGDSEWRQQRVQYHNGREAISLSGIHLSSRTVPDPAQRLSAEERISIDRFIVSGTAYGPGKLNLAIRHLPQPSIERLARLQWQSVTLPFSKAEAQLALQQFAIHALAEVPALIAADPAIELNTLSLQTPQGEIRGEFHFNISGVAIADSLNLPLIRRHSHLSLDLQIPAALLPKDQRLERMIRQGLVRLDKGMLRTHARLEKGLLTINGQPVALPF